MQVTVNGKTIQAVQGQRLRDVVLAAKAKVEYGCEKVKKTKKMSIWQKALSRQDFTTSF